ncbi:hypothetical protein EVAR_71436_1 [Eumeta japonica]|uniref:Uncharacterized protein n=1 Tax=Eumeta variegata TaxID=151549 RepID=A0A4C1SFB1_EUMVA|nr:hypothetical protein EVAR_71436_1 [Eumeta japonica]
MLLVVLDELFFVVQYAQMFGDRESRRFGRMSRVITASWEMGAVTLSGLEVLSVALIYYVNLVVSQVNTHRSKEFALGWHKLRGGQKKRRVAQEYIAASQAL